MLDKKNLFCCYGLTPINYKHQKVLFTDSIDLDASKCFRYYWLNTLDNRAFELRTLFIKVSSSDKY